MQRMVSFVVAVAVVFTSFITSSDALVPRFPSLKREPSRSGSAPPYQTLWFDQVLDHFNFGTKPATWRQRYLYNDQYWNGNFTNTGCPGPIFFYTGNESPVVDYWENSGFFTEVLAPKYHGLLIMAEHRYFGESQPFGTKSQQPGFIDYLSPEQALADYANLLTAFKRNNSRARDCPIIAFGGSYGGMLTTWFRAKYPNIVVGGLAASAPFAFDGTGLSPYTFMDTCQNTYATAGVGCDTAVSQSLRAIAKAATSSAGLQQISEAFGLCEPLSSMGDAEMLLAYVQGGLVDMAMLDYPYAADYGVHFPAWPVNTTCTALLKEVGTDPIKAMGVAIQSFYNSTGTVSCLNMTKDVPDWGVCCAWNYLACTELYIPSVQRGMWYPETTWNVSADVASCQAQFGVTMKPLWANVEFGGFDLSAASNIIFSNGLLDPWHTSGILKSLSPTLTAVVIPAAAHHLDLRGPHEGDPIYVQQARLKEESIIAGWINDHFKAVNSRSAAN